MKNYRTEESKPKLLTHHTTSPDPDSKIMIRSRQPKSTARLKTEASVHSSVYTLKPLAIKTFCPETPDRTHLNYITEMGHFSTILSERGRHYVNTAIPGPRTQRNGKS
jgi:hypothetical protein